MNPKIPNKEKARNAGISLKPDLTALAKALAKKLGLSLSAYTTMLLVKELEKSGEANLKKSRDTAARGKAKIKQAIKKKK